MNEPDIALYIHNSQVQSPNHVASHTQICHCSCSSYNEFWFTTIQKRVHLHSCPPTEFCCSPCDLGTYNALEDSYWMTTVV